MAWGNLLFKFDGRLNRAKYWLAVLVYVAVYLVLALLNLITGDSVAVQGVGGMVELVVLISSIAVGIKRLHDRDKSGWYLILFYVVPGILVVVGVVVSLTSEDTALIGSVLWLIAAAIGVWSIVELGCLRGTIGPNQYGSDPLPPPIEPVPT